MAAHHGHSDSVETDNADRTGQELDIDSIHYKSIWTCRPRNLNFQHTKSKLLFSSELKLTKFNICVFICNEKASPGRLGSPDQCVLFLELNSLRSPVIMNEPE